MNWAQGQCKGARSIDAHTLLMRSAPLETLEASGGTDPPPRPNINRGLDLTCFHPTRRESADHARRPRAR
eukprot:6203092-Pleurochrysis_carterae.AAC.2